MSAASAAQQRTIRRVAGAILFGIAAAEGIPFVLLLPSLGRALMKPQSLGAMIAAGAIAAAYIVVSARNPGVRRHLADRSWLRVPAVLVAVIAGVFEEVFFRRWFMDTLQAHGIGIVGQVLLSGAFFGAVHAVWGFRAGWGVAASVAGVNGALGTALAILYAADGRVVVPCIVAHLIIDLVLEPALILNAVEAGFARRNSWWAEPG